MCVTTRRNSAKIHLAILSNFFEIAASTFVGFLLDKTMSGEAMVFSALNEINKKLKFLYCNSFLTPALRHLLCNALTQPCFVYVCYACYSNMTKKFLDANKVIYRFKQSVKSIDFKYFNEKDS